MASESPASFSSAELLSGIPAFSSIFASTWITREDKPGDAQSHLPAGTRQTSGEPSAPVSPTLMPLMWTGAEAKRDKQQLDTTSMEIETRGMMVGHGVQFTGTCTTMSLEIKDSGHMAANQQESGSTGGLVAKALFWSKLTGNTNTEPSDVASHAQSNSALVMLMNIIRHLPDMVPGRPSPNRNPAVRNRIPLPPSRKRSSAPGRNPAGAWSVVTRSPDTTLWK
mmetsp:Transcript_116750/g.337272  ORF Transcript_116750/g.337272 Transcript_116750/m.337272 type:complete len:224 (+) Transcript_116750:242-913(+)